MNQCKYKLNRRRFRRLIQVLSESCCFANITMLISIITALFFILKRYYVLAKLESIIQTLFILSNKEAEYYVSGFILGLIRIR